jgi:hypothetical protein
MISTFADIVLVSEDEAKTWGDVYGTVIHAALAEGRPGERRLDKQAKRDARKLAPAPSPDMPGDTLIATTGESVQPDAGNLSSVE